MRRRLASVSVLASLTFSTPLQFTAPVITGHPLLPVQTPTVPNTSQMPGLSQSLRQITNLLDRGRGIEAENLARAVLRKVEAVKGPDALEAAQVLDLLYRAVRRSPQVSNADKLAIVERAVKIKENLLSATDPELATSLMNLGVQRTLGGDPLSAKPPLERALAIREQIFGPDHPLVAGALQSLGGLLMVLHDDDGAKRLLERAQRIREAFYGPGHVDTIRTLINLAILYQETGDYAGAKERYERALVLTENIAASVDPQTLNLLTGAARVLKDLGGEFAASSRLYERLLTLLEHAYGPTDERLRDPLASLALDLRDMGEYATAKTFAERSLSISERDFGPTDLNVAISLHILATIVADMGDYGEAMRLFERATRIKEQTTHPSDPDVDRASRIIPELFPLSGYSSDDVIVFERIAELVEKTRDAGGPTTNEILTNLAALLSSAADFNRTRPLFERALAFEEKLRSPDHLEVAIAATNLGYVRSQTGDVTGAKELYTRALHICEKSLGSDNPRVATALQNLARLELQSRNYAEAKPLLNRALAIQEQKLGPEHPEVAGTLARLAEVQAHTGATAEAFATAVRAEGIRREHMRLTARTLPERQALAYLSSAPSAMDVMLSIAASHLSDVQTVTAAWNAVIRARGIVFDEMAARNRAASGVEDPEVAALTNTLRSARQRLAAAVLRGPSDSAGADYRIALDRSRLEKDFAERALAEKSGRFRADQTNDRIGVAETAAALPEGNAVVAFVKFRRHAVDGSVSSATAESGENPSYLGFVLRAGDIPTLVPLGTVADIEGLILQWRRQIDQEAIAGGNGSKPSEAAYRRVAGQLRQRIWDPLVPYLSGSTRVFIIPDGALHLVSFASLPTDTSQYLIDSGPSIHYLSTERDVVTQDTNPSFGSGLLALGGAAFNESDQGTVTVAAPLRRTRSACIDFQSIQFEPLPDSLTEVSDLVSLWKHTHNAESDANGQRPETLQLTEAAATESAFKGGAAGRRILHLATHAFFLGGRCATQGEPPTPLTRAGTSARIARENPLLLSGLVLAGANNRNAAAPNQEDGLLTAEEVAAMNLTGVEWAVLSGCDTGAGEIKAGEGVFGLRRAFQLAGARTVIMSLWPVADRTTRQWMKTLYEGRLIKRLSTADAVRGASIRLLRQRRAEHLSTHPFYWGGFVAAGDWR